MSSTTNASALLPVSSIRGWERARRHEAPAKHVQQSTVVYYSPTPGMPNWWRRMVFYTGYEPPARSIRLEDIGSNVLHLPGILARQGYIAPGTGNVILPLRQLLRLPAPDLPAPQAAAKALRETRRVVLRYGSALIVGRGAVDLLVDPVFTAGCTAAGIRLRYKPEYDGGVVARHAPAAVVRAINNHRMAVAAAARARVFPPDALDQLAYLLTERVRHALGVPVRWADAFARNRQARLYTLRQLVGLCWLAWTNTERAGITRELTGLNYIGRRLYTAVSAVEARLPAAVRGLRIPLGVRPEKLRRQHYVDEEALHLKYLCRWLRAVAPAPHNEEPVFPPLKPRKEFKLCARYSTKRRYARAPSLCLK